MKKNRNSRLLIGLFITFFSVSVFASEFCDGFKQGYITGYKQKNGTSIGPIAPICPIKPMKGFGDPKSDFEFGYTIGFKTAMTEG